MQRCICIYYDKLLAKFFAFPSFDFVVAQNEVTLHNLLADNKRLRICRVVVTDDMSLVTQKLTPKLNEKYCELTPPLFVQKVEENEERVADSDQQYCSQHSLIRVGGVN